MGFTAELHVISAEKWPCRQYANKANAKYFTFWRPFYTLPFGRVTRLEKITDERFQHITYSSRERAGICATSWILRNLVEKLKRLSLDEFAPPFLAESPGMTLSPDRPLKEDSVYVSADKYQPSIFEEDLWRRDFRERTSRHNEIIALPPQKLRYYLENEYNIVLEAPIMWEKCSEIAGWFADMKIEDAEEWREVQKDPAALALFRAWHASLAELGGAGTRALFVFS